MFAANVTVTKAPEAKTWADSALLVHPRSPVGTMRTAVSSRVPYAILRGSEAIAPLDDAQLQELAFSANSMSCCQVGTLRTQHGRDGMSEVRKTRKDE